jgi:predicted nucleotidyltransferase
MYLGYEEEIEGIMDDDTVGIFFLHDLELLTDNFPQVDEIYLFGSRRYPHQSLRSDIDLLVVVDDFLKPADIRKVVEGDPALDIFLVNGGTATSCANESFVSAGSFCELVKKLDAVKIWSKVDGYIAPPNIKPFFKIRKDVEFKMTAMPNAFFKPYTFDERVADIEASGLPVSPIIGENFEAAAVFLASVAERIVLAKNYYGKSKGQAKNSWVTELKSEYDFQDLFEIVCKPFIPNLSREEVSIFYDGRKKISDFSFFKSQVVIEMKYVKDHAKASEVVKTLSGLKDFYVQNSNVKVLLFVIYVDVGVNLDDRRWEADFSFYSTSPRVITKVIRNA